MSETPRTDACEAVCLHVGAGDLYEAMDELVLLSRTLERELAASEARERALKEALTRIRDARRNPEVALTDMSRAGMRELAGATLAAQEKP